MLPVLIRRSAGSVNASIRLYLYRNQFQLTNTDVYYSDGTRYKPAIEVVNHLKTVMPNIKKVLVLGTGLGSMVNIMHSQNFFPKFTLVEIDKVILSWAIELMAPAYLKDIIPVCDDARGFLNRNADQYDLIFIDIFFGRVVPDFVTEKAFLMLCREHLSKGGHVAFNYIINNENEWNEVYRTFSGIFSDCKVIKQDINRILIS